ncbi:MAG: transposase [Verrucomicrobia bacterium]|nr:transposase [Verrucomicrobiota bacterium]MBV9657628.1 transposase [Verrucomicrobiota bacterium]
MQVFLDRFAAAHAQQPDEIQVLLLDNGGAHRAKKLRWPERVVPAYLLAYCPELNPIERWWQELKDALSPTNSSARSMPCAPAWTAHSPLGTKTPCACAHSPAIPTSSTLSHRWIDCERWYQTKITIKLKC